MELETIVQELKNIGNRLLASNTHTIDCYLFGSILTIPRIANDIDILIVYKDFKQLNIVKKEIKLLITYYPIHMNYFTFFEEKELDFVKQQITEKIFSL